jgi:hypothetical protein
MAEAQTAIKGYTPVSETNRAEVNRNKDLEEVILRRIDKLYDDDVFDARWLAIARTNIEQGFMALNRAIMRPQRVMLPGEE